MKGHKSHHHAKHRKLGGSAVESAKSGVNEAEQDLHTKAVKYTGGRPEAEAEEMGERKHGGRAKRKHGGHVKHVAMHGHEGHKHAGRKPRKSGGRTGSEKNPFTSAHHGTAPKGHHVEKETMG